MVRAVRWFRQNTDWHRFQTKHSTLSLQVITCTVSLTAHVQGVSLTIDDFELITVIGKGSFGKVSNQQICFPYQSNHLVQVMQVRKRDTSRIYALKTIRKQHIVERGEITHTLAERLVLARVNNPFIVPLKFSFQSQQKLYLVLA